ncbi:MAG: hypothetical protein ACPGJV_07775 [Bacteriovoracaceae bacterium]
MKNLFILLLSTFLFSSSSWAWNKKLALKGGVHTNYIHLGALNQSEQASMGAGFNTHFGYKYNRWTFDISSHISFAPFENLDLKAQDIQLNKVNGDIRNLSIGTIFKYKTSWEPKPTWNFIVGVGPLWSLLTLKIDDDLTDQGFSAEDKFVYESQGFTFVLGLHEQTEYKEMHPVYIELVFEYLKSHELSTVDASDSAEIVIRSKEEIKQVESFLVLLSMGIILF